MIELFECNVCHVLLGRQAPQCPVCHRGAVTKVGTIPSEEEQK